MANRSERRISAKQRQQEGHRHQSALHHTNSPYRCPVSYASFLQHWSRSAFHEMRLSLQLRGLSDFECRASGRGYGSGEENRGSGGAGRDSHRRSAKQYFRGSPEAKTLTLTLVLGVANSYFTQHIRSGPGPSTAGVEQSCRFILKASHRRFMDRRHGCRALAG